MANVEIPDKKARGLQFSERKKRAAPARLLSDVVDSSDVATTPQKTLVVYSGPTSMNRLQDKNGIYIDNMNYFLEHGMSCSDDAHPGSSAREDDNTEYVIVNYAFVLTQEVADYYTAPNGPLTKKMRECEGVEKRVRAQKGERTPFIQVITRQDRCYDMESIRTVVTKVDVQALYNNILFINCGLVGPKFGSGTPKLVPSTSSTHKPDAEQNMVPYSHWSQLYTSRLTDSVRLVGHSINTHFHTFFPHVQSFLYAAKTDTVPILLSSGAIYDCGLTKEELEGDAEKRFELINRYEVGMSTQLLGRGYRIAAAFVNRYGFGKSLIYDKDSVWGTEIDDTVSDIWYEETIRNLTTTLSEPTPEWWTRPEGRPTLRKPDEDTFEYHRRDILPWDYFVFFKVSRFVPEDIQNEMNYDRMELERSDVLVVPNDPRKSPGEYWVRKSAALADERINSVLDSVWKIAVVCLFVLGFFMKRSRIVLMKRFRPEKET